MCILGNIIFRGDYMLLNIIVGFITPILFGIILFKKDKKIVLFIAPVNSVLAFIIINLETCLNFWNLYPFSKGDAFTAIPYCIGLFPFNACLLIYVIDKKIIKLRDNILVFLCAVFTTFEEALGILAGRVIYSNGWNIGFTFISYLIPMYLSFLYYKYLKSIELL